jgi:hypothetical protein
MTKDEQTLRFLDVVAAKDCGKELRHNLQMDLSYETVFIDPLKALKDPHIFSGYHPFFEKKACFVQKHRSRIGSRFT